MNTTKDESHGAEARWCVEEQPTGMPVAQGSAPTADEAIREATHYAVQYAQDGPVRWWVRQNRKTVVQGSIAHTTTFHVLKA